MLKRIFCAILAALLLVSVALAEGMTDFDDYAAALSAPEGAEWAADGDMRVLDMGEEVTVSVCLEGESVVALTVEAPIGTLAQAERAALEALGLLSDEEIDEFLTAVEVGKAENDAFAFWRMQGKNREGIAICSAEDADELYWIPIHGGKKYHVNMSCSGMDVARLVTQKAAQDEGLEPCGRCKNR